MKICCAWVLAGVCLLLSGCATAPRDTVAQVSTIDALLSGAYDGQQSCRDLLTHGDFGIGTGRWWSWMERSTR